MVGLDNSNGRDRGSVYVETERLVIGAAEGQYMASGNRPEYVCLFPKT